MPTGKPTMQDVAHRAGVSVATVSHVLNGSRPVAEATRLRVQQSIQALHYSPNEVARTFKTGRRGLVGFVVPDIANEFFATLIQQVEEALAGEGYRLILTNTSETPQREAESVRALAGGGLVDGLIVASTLECAAELAQALPPGFPLVLVDRTLPAAPWDGVEVSTRTAMAAGVQALLQGGHRRIGYIAGLRRLSTTAERLDAFTRAIRAHGHEAPPPLVRYGDSMRQSAATHAQSLVQQGCTALVVANNVMTVDVLDWLAEQNLRPGRDVALLGFWDSPGGAARGIAAVAQPVAELGALAGRQLLQRLAAPSAPLRQTVLQAVYRPGV